MLCFLEAGDLDQSTLSETELFTKYYNEWKGAGKGKTKSYDAIPRFYFKVNEFRHVSSLNLSRLLLSLSLGRETFEGTGR